MITAAVSKHAVHQKTATFVLELLDSIK